MAGGVRLDAWVWAVRLAPTRTAATAAVKAGHVRLGGAGAKPSARVEVGDRVSVRRGTWLREVEVVELRAKRVGAALAEASYRVIADERPDSDGPTAAWGVRDRGSGRPTKRDRRRMERWERSQGGRGA
ncbi:MAG: S4 domain-containing protein [Microthrixaceae bacterium]